MLTCLLYGNCQMMDGVYNLTTQVYKPFSDKYTVNRWYAHVMLREKHDIDEDLLKNVDLFIYQPIDDRHGDYATNNIISKLKDGCKTISVPYVYNSAIFSTYVSMMTYIISDGKRCKPEDDILEFENKSKLHGFGDVFKMIKDKKSLQDIIKTYRNGSMNFDFEYRWNECIKNLRKREENCDVKVADFLESNRNDHLLFITHNHPTTPVYLHIFGQIIGILDINDEVLNYEYYDIAYMLKSIGNHPFQAYVQHFNMNMKYIGCIDQYSKKYIGKFNNVIEWDKHTESEIVDYYMNYQSVIVKTIKT